MIRWLKDLRDWFDARFLIGRRLDDEIPRTVGPGALPGEVIFGPHGSIVLDERQRIAAEIAIKLAQQNAQIRREIATQFYIASLRYEGNSMKHAALAARAVRSADCLLHALETGK